MKTLGYMIGTTIIVGTSFMVSTIIVNAIRNRMATATTTATA